MQTDDSTPAPPPGTQAERLLALLLAQADELCRDVVAAQMGPHLPIEIAAPDD